MQWLRGAVSNAVVDHEGCQKNNKLMFSDEITGAGTVQGWEQLLTLPTWRLMFQLPMVVGKSEDFL